MLPNRTNAIILPLSWEPISRSAMYNHKYPTPMAYKISEECVACGTCISECPVEAISEGDIYKIDPDKCVDCGTCADACPTGAIKQ